MNEYWVNVYPTGLGVGKFANREWALIASYATPVLFCLHIKLKDKPGLTRHYPLKMIDGMVTLNVFPKYEKLT